MKRYLPAILVFLAIAAMLVTIEARPQFPDPDSFYHAKLALFIRDEGFIHAFPWLHYTVLADQFVDYHLGYHMLLIPFVTLFDPLVGMKISAALFGLVPFLALYFFLKFLRAPRPEVFVALAALSASFLHRMSLPRAPALSVALLVWCTYALLKRKYWMITAASAIYVWYYYGWPLLVIVAGAMCVADFLTTRLDHQKQSFWETIRAVRQRQTRPILQMFLGMGIGIVVNPYFPQNIIATARDVFKLAVVNYHHVVPVGREWFPATPEDILTASPFLLGGFAMAAALLLSVAATQKQAPQRQELFPLFTVLLLGGGFLVLTLKSNRFIEYAIPFVALATGALASFSWPVVKEEILPDLKRWFPWRPGRSLIPSVLLFAVFSFAVRETKNAFPNPDHFTADQYRVATDWITANIPDGEIVFHNSWDFSLVLFYLDDHHRYLVGLDPTYMYDAYREDYDLWTALVNGEDADVGKILTHFQARAVVIDKRIDTSFDENVEASGLFKKIASNGTVVLYAAQ